MATNATFAAMTSAVCSIKRNNLLGAGSTVTGYKCTPLAPVDAETKLRQDINTPYITWETHLQANPDIKKGDILIISSVEYPIYRVEKWPWLPNDDVWMRLVVEDVRNGV